MGLMRGMNFVSYHSLPLGPQQDEPCGEAGDHRDPQVDEDGLRQLADADFDRRALQAHRPGQHGDKDVGVDAVEQHLENTIESHQARRVLGIALRQLVPHDHHGDAARQPDQDQADHVLRVVVQEEDGQHEHQDRADDPVLHQRQAQHLDVPEDLGQALILHLGERRIHHQDQADRDQDVGRPDLEAVDELLNPRNEITEAHADRHGQEDPQRQEAVEGREAFGCAGGRSRCSSMRHESSLSPFFPVSCFLVSLLFPCFLVSLFLFPCVPVSLFPCFLVYQRPYLPLVREHIRKQGCDSATEGTRPALASLSLITRPGV